MAYLLFFSLKKRDISHGHGLDQCPACIEHIETGIEVSHIDFCSRQLCIGIGNFLIISRKYIKGCQEND